MRGPLLVLRRVMSRPFIAHLGRVVGRLRKFDWAVPFLLVISLCSRFIAEQCSDTCYVQ
jgi:hypothetical protein